MRATKILVGSVCSLVLGTAAPVDADTARVYCHLHVKSPGIKLTDNAANCQFSQSQGNVHVVMYLGNRAPLRFEFPASKQNVTYQRLNHAAGIKFTTPVLTLKVFWADPGTSHRF